MSYLTVKIQKKIEFDNECKCLVDYSELEKAILWYQKKPSLSKKKIYLHGHYPAVSIHNEKIHVHRLLMQYWLRTRIPFEYSVHHLNWIASHYGCDWSTIRNRIYENPELLEVSS